MLFYLNPMLQLLFVACSIFHTLFVSLFIENYADIISNVTLICVLVGILKANYADLLFESNHFVLWWMYLDFTADLNLYMQMRRIPTVGRPGRWSGQDGVDGFWVELLCLCIWNMLLLYYLNPLLHFVNVYMWNKYAAALLNQISLSCGGYTLISRDICVCICGNCL